MNENRVSELFINIKGKTGQTLAETVSMFAYYNTGCF